MPEYQYKRATISFLQVANQLHGDIAEALLPFNLSHQQLKVLAILNEEADARATVNRIRERMMDPMSNVSRLLNKLVEKQLIEKQRSDEDQRIVYIHLLPEGKKLLVKGANKLDSTLRTFCKLSDTELNKLEAILNKLKS